jgi:small subunit ribosomal protein S8
MRKAARIHPVFRDLQNLLSRADAQGLYSGRLESQLVSRMVMTDPIADMLTRIRNGQRSRHAEVVVPYSRLKHQIANVLVREGYLARVSTEGTGPQKSLRITLKYDRNGQTLEPVITNVRRLSKPGRRLYASVSEIPRPLNGLGIVVLSTSGGVISDREARKRRLGGELICEVW